MSANKSVKTNLKKEKCEREKSEKSIKYNFEIN